MTDADPRIDTDVALIVLDDTGMIVDWSDAAAATMGWSISQLLGRYFDALVPEQYTDAAWKLFQVAMQDAEGADELDGRRLHLPVTCSDGDIRVFAARLGVVRDPQGAVCAGVVTLTGPTDAEAFAALD